MKEILPLTLLTVSAAALLLAAAWHGLARAEQATATTEDEERYG